MKFLNVVAVAAAMALAAPAQAQFSTNVTPNNDGGQFWNNRSSDGKKCNIGYVLNNTATSGGCANERPDKWLDALTFAPTPTEYRTSNTFGPFNSDVNAIQFTVFGDIAGQNRDFGIFTLNGQTRNLISFNDKTTNFPFFVTATGPWGFYINTTNGVNAFSDVDGQFAWFRVADGTTNYFGLEDTRTSGGDRDYNDVVLRAVGPVVI